MSTTPINYLEILKNKVKVGDKLSDKGDYKIVEKTPPYRCANYLHHQGFRIQIGAKSSINVPLSILEEVITESKARGGIYNKSILESV